MCSSEEGAPGPDGHRLGKGPPPVGRGRHLRADRGFVTAEAAVVIPALAAFALALLWGLMAAAAQIQCLDAARAGARAAARSEAEQEVLAAARSAAPPGARVALRRDGDLWRVRVEAPTPGPHALALTLSGDAAALAEDTVGRPLVGEER
ncbi:TadE family type IV pilus minor pilin [Streptomyces sp. YS-3]|uniref:TadE family type IV pilus minor pilin n=1 Tax=Streptomyces sp. YS-3 TaxID=3381352 RepID=UPI00386289FD